MRVSISINCLFVQAQTQFILLTLTSYSYEKPLRLYQPQWLQTVDKVPVFAGTFTMSTVFLV